MNNTQINAIDSTTALTNDELVNLRAILGIPDVNYMTQLINTLTTGLSNFVNNQNEAMKEIRLEQNRQNETIANIMGEVRDAINASAKNQNRITEAIYVAKNSYEKINKATVTTEKNEDPLFTRCSKNAKERELWVQKIKGIVADASLIYHISDALIYKDVWSRGIKNSEYNIDINATFEEYKKSHPNTDRLSMCAASDILSLNLEKEINTSIHKLSVRKLKSLDTNADKPSESINKNVVVPNIKSAKRVRRTYPVRISRSVPNDIRDAIIKAYGSASSMTYSKAYKKFEKTSGINIDEFTSNIKKQYDLESCSYGFAISLDSAIKRKFFNCLAK